MLKDFVAAHAAFEADLFGFFNAEFMKASWTFFAA
jgi:hypothetical protein